MAPKSKVQTKNKTQNPRKETSGKVAKASTTKAKSLKSTNKDGPKYRMTSNFVIFGGGPLSNWHKGNPYSGRRALDLMIERLDEAHIEHPTKTATSSGLLAHHSFVCGEQWMMAIKGWLFERDIELLEDPIDNRDFDKFAAEMHAKSKPKGDQPKKLRAYESTLCKVLRTAKPIEQKQFGRKCMNYVDDVWKVASVPTVVACSIARAEANPTLKAVYTGSGERNFVEGSLRDRIWGVGLPWNSPLIDYREEWRGANRLGQCHDQARAFICSSAGNTVAPP